MHILYVFPEPLPLPRARGLQVAHFVRALALEGAKVTLAYVPGEGEHPFVSIGYDVPENVALLPLSRNLPLTRIKSQRFFMWRLADWLNQERKSGKGPSVVFFRHVKAAVHFAQQFSDIPFVYEAHEVFAHTAKSSQQERMFLLEAEVLYKASLIVAISNGAADGLKRNFKLQKPIIILPSAVEVPDSLPEKPWAESKLHLIYAGSLFGWKGVDDLVDALNILPGFNLTIIGGNIDQIERLKKRRSSSGGEVSFIGHLSYCEVQSALAGSCVAVLPNRADSVSAFTSPLKLFEYMAAGCAIVASDLPVLHEVLGNDGAAWAQPNDPASLANAIRQVCEQSDGGASLGSLSRERVRPYTWRSRGNTLIRHIAALN